MLAQADGSSIKHLNEQLENSPNFEQYCAGCDR